MKNCIKELYILISETKYVNNWPMTIQTQPYYELSVLTAWPGLPEPRRRNGTRQALDCSSTAHSCTVVVPSSSCAAYKAGDLVVQTLFVL